MRRVSKTLVAALAVFLLAAGLAACGGGDDSSSTAAEAGGGQAESKASGAASGQSNANSGGESKSGPDGEGTPSDSTGGDRQSERSSFVPKQHNDSGGGSQRYRVKGGDNSVQEFGDEADTAERDDAAVALHNFLDARAESNWAAACGYMAKSIVESFEKLAEKAKQIEDKSCAGILEKLTNPAAKAALKAEAAQADVGSLRIEGERAFVIYTSIDGTILAMPMENEGGAWKVASLAGTPLN